DPGAAVDHQARALLRGQGLLEHLKLWTPANNRPALHHDRHVRQHGSHLRRKQSCCPGTGDHGRCQALTTAERSVATTATTWLATSAGTPSPSSVAARWAAVRSNCASVMPRLRWLAARSGPR